MALARLTADLLLSVRTNPHLSTPHSMLEILYIAEWQKADRSILQQVFWSNYQSMTLNLKIMSVKYIFM